MSSAVVKALEAHRPGFDRESHIYTGSRNQIIPSVSQLIEPLKAYDGIPEHVLEAAAKRGEAAHLAVLQYCESGSSWGLDDTEQVHVDRFIKALDAAVIDLSEIIGCEVPLMHPTMGYAGTIDVLIQRGNNVQVIDLKTGQMDMSCSWIAQVSLYTELVRAVLREMPGIMVANPIIFWTGCPAWAQVDENRTLAMSAWTMYRNKNGRQISWNRIKL